MHFPFYYDIRNQENDSIRLIIYDIHKCQWELIETSNQELATSDYFEINIHYSKTINFVIIGTSLYSSWKSVILIIMSK